jgi:hypothetical protein
MQYGEVRDLYHDSKALDSLERITDLGALKIIDLHSRYKAAAFVIFLAMDLV